MVSGICRCESIGLPMLRADTRATLTDRIRASAVIFSRKCFYYTIARDGNVKIKLDVKSKGGKGMEEVMI